MHKYNICISLDFTFIIILFFLTLGRKIYGKKEKDHGR